MPEEKRCPECNDILMKLDIVNAETGEEKGHVWACTECDRRYVGFGEPGEYEGTSHAASEERISKGV